MPTKPLAFVLLLLTFGLASGLRAQDWAKAKLDQSPRHGEWVNLPSNGRDLKCFVVYPEVKDKAPVVLVIHEIFGMTDWVRDTCDQLAAAGYIAIAPDFLSGQTPGGDARQAISKLPPAQIMTDLDAAFAYAGKIPAANGKIAVVGFCWGGGQSFAYAVHNPDVKAAFVFYGTGPATEADASKINCPVYGFYAENDARVSATIPATQELMKKTGKIYEPVTYAGAGHGFMRAGEAPDTSPANGKARQDAWERWKSLLQKL